MPLNAQFAIILWRAGGIARSLRRHGLHTLLPAGATFARQTPLPPFHLCRVLVWDIAIMDATLPLRAMHHLRSCQQNIWLAEENTSPALPCFHFSRADSSYLPFCAFPWRLCETWLLLCQHCSLPTWLNMSRCTVATLLPTGSLAPPAFLPLLPTLSGSSQACRLLLRCGS